MNKQIFAIYDRKANIYQNPVFANHVVEITRSLESAVTKEGVPFNTHTSDYELYRLGSFNPETGQSDLEPKPVLILNLQSLKQEQN